MSNSFKSYALSLSAHRGWILRKSLHSVASLLNKLFFKKNFQSSDFHFVTVKECYLMTTENDNDCIYGAEKLLPNKTQRIITVIQTCIEGGGGIKGIT